jgi:hypothetical protein
MSIPSIIKADEFQIDFTEKIEKLNLSKQEPLKEEDLPKKGLPHFEKYEEAPVQPKIIYESDIIEKPNINLN